MKKKDGKDVKILSGKGKEWSEEAAAVMDLFSEWVNLSGMERMECLNRVDGSTFKICFSREPDSAEIRLTDEAGEIGLAFPWDRESGIPYADYLTDAGFLLLHIGSMCHNEKSIKKINDFVTREIMS